MIGFTAQKLLFRRLSSRLIRAGPRIRLRTAAASLAAVTAVQNSCFASYEMSWRAVGSSNADLVSKLRGYGIIETDAVAAAMAAVDRRLFVPDELQGEAYRDNPVPIGHSATISAPHMHAHCLELALPVLPPSGARILDVGSGSGYLSAVLARLRPGARIIGVEYVPELVANSLANLRKDPSLAALLEHGTIEIRCGDGWAGAPDAAPFHYIHVGAAAERVPEALVAQVRSSAAVRRDDASVLAQHYAIVTSHEILCAACILISSCSLRRAGASSYPSARASPNL